MKTQTFNWNDGSEDKLTMISDNNTITITSDSNEEKDRSGKLILSAILDPTKKLEININQAGARQEFNLYGGDALKTKDNEEFLVLK